MKLVRLVCATVALAVPSLSVRAQTAGSAPAETPICADRPTKANSTCTVPEGHFQVETDLANWTRSTSGGVVSEVLLAPNPTLKYGVSKSFDVELEWAPYEWERTKGPGGTSTATSAGDVFLKAKWEPIGGDALSLAFIPYVKAPTANRELGNGRVEGGISAPVAVSLPAKLVLTFGPEADVLANAAGGGAHLNLVNLVNLSRTWGRWTLAAELWNDQNFDPSGDVNQTTADVAVSVLTSNTTQLDIGANFGVNRAAPTAQLYAGIAHRF